MRLRVRGDLAILIGALLVASACATPVGVVRGNPQSVYRALTASVLSTGEPSASTAQVLRRRGLATRFEDEPEAVLTELRGTGVGLSRDRLFALAELSFAHADKAKKREYYLASAVYAYAFLLPDEAGARRQSDRSALAARCRPLQPRPDPRACPRRTVPPASSWRRASQPLPFGTLTLAIDPAQLHLGRLSDEPTSSRWPSSSCGVSGIATASLAWALRWRRS